MKSAFRFLFFLLTGMTMLQAQENRARSGHDPSMNLDQAFKKLEKDRKVHLAYNPEICERFDVPQWDEAKSASAQLDQILRELPFTVSSQDESHFIIVYDEAKLRRLEASRQIRTTVQVSGRIEDVNSGEPVIGALLIIMPDGITAETDTTGRFAIRGVSRHEKPWLEIRYVGYQTQVIAQVSTVKQPVRIKLFPEISELPPVTISTLRPVIQMERLEKTVNRYATSFDYRIQSNAYRDPVRYVQQTTAGINATDDRSSGLQIRGSNPDENLIRLNGLTLFNIDHFYGVFTNINPYIISSIDLYKSYFPARFGGRTSSVIHMKSPEEINRWHGGADLNLITANAYLQAPLSDRISLVAGARTTTLNLGDSKTFNSLLRNNQNTGHLLGSTDSTQLIAIHPNYKFNDQFAKLDIRPLRRMKMSFSYFGSHDMITSGYSSKELAGQLREGEYQEASDWKTQAYNAAVSYDWSRALSSEVILSRSGLDFSQDISSRITNKYSDFTELSKVSNRLVNSNLRLDNKWTVGNAVCHFGAEFNNNETRAVSTFNKNDFILDTAHKNEVAAFVHTDLRVFGKLTLSPGFRLSSYGTVHASDPSPRMAVTMQWDRHHQTSLHYGRYFQYLRQSRYEDRFGREYYLWVQSDGKKYPTLVSDQYELVHAMKYGKHSLKTEVYYKSIHGVVENLVILSEPPLNNEPLKLRNESLIGRGRYYGADLTYEFHTRWYQAYLIYSYNMSQNSFPQIENGAWYRKAFAREHQLKTNHQFHADRWDLSLNAVYGSPQPYNDFTTSGSQPRDRRPRQQTRYLSDYFRVDADLRYTIPFRRSRLEFSLSVLNLFDRRNTKYAQSLFTFSEQNGGPSTRSKKYVVGAEVETLRRTLNAGIGFHF